MEEREINLKWLLYNIAMSWRKILVAMIICAVAMDGVGYLRKKANLNGQMSQEESLKAGLSDAAIERTERLAKRYIENKIQLDEMILYKEDSIWLNLNPACIPTIEVEYLVTIGGQTKVESMDIIKSYLSAIRQVEFTPELEAIGKVPYLRELIRVEDSVQVEGTNIQIEMLKSNVLRYSIVAPDEEICHSLSQLVHSQIETVTPLFKERYGNFTIEQISETYFEDTNKELRMEQNEDIAQFYRLNDYQETMKTRLGTEEQEYYDYLIQQDVAEGEFVEKKEESAPVSPIQPKYALVGLILGVFLVCVYEAMRYCMTQKVYFTDDFVSQIPVELMGVVHQQSRWKGIDRLIHNMFVHQDHGLSEDEQIELIASHIRILAEKQDYKQLFLAGSGHDKLVRQIAERFIQKSHGSISYGSNVLKDPKNMERMAAADGVIFIEQLGTFTYSAILEEIRLCKEYQLSIVGSILVES